MIKPEWGTKRACPKCNTRFYDLGHDDPVTCIACGTAFIPDAILKSKQPLPFEVAKPVAETAEPAEGADSDLDIDAEETEPTADADVDIGGDDDLDAVVDREAEEEA